MLLHTGCQLSLTAIRYYVIEDGRINSGGTHSELLSMNGLYAKMWQAHISAKDTQNDNFQVSEITRCADFMEKNESSGAAELLEALPQGGAENV